MSTEAKNIVIIGGGIIGSTTSYFLTRHPKYNASLHKITLLEATAIASGASGKAGGLLALWAYPRCIVPLSFNLHKALAEEHGGKDRWGYRGVGVGSIEINGRGIGRGSIRASRDGVGKKEEVRGVHDAGVEGSDGNANANGNGNSNGKAHVSLEKRSEDSYGNLRKMGVPDDLDWVVDGCVTGYESMGSPRDTAQVHPYEFTTSMAKLAEEKGVEIVMGKCVGIDVEGGDKKSVRYKDKETGEEKVVRDVTDVIVTAGPWTKNVWPGTPIGALRAHSVTIRPSQPVSAYALFTQIALPKNFKEGVKSKAMHVSPEIYARPNNELYACGEGDHLVPLPETSDQVEVDDARCQDIVDYCAAFSDEMRDGEVLVRQACYLPQAERGNGPFIGPTHTSRIFIASGHTCWGIQNGPATGKLMSEFIFDGKAVSADIDELDPRMVLRK